jgi:hypothetical protein
VTIETLPLRRFIALVLRIYWPDTLAVEPSGFNQASAHD